MVFLEEESLKFLIISHNIHQVISSVSVSLYTFFSFTPTKFLNLEVEVLIRVELQQRILKLV